ncbi:hypothetical protein PPYR_10645 [Photinus pyralis]|uniref:RING-type domain-containing protein n=3 Tax=Photinus pyralis TaxID=7054 RepID=A0A5N4AGY2_PHOPY|nr:hypothetical protein PPYR_10645 [Photinus pyralis]
MEKYKTAECPICFEVFPDKIFQCMCGHSLCESCSAITIRCPICNDYMTTIRNFTLEALIEESRKKPHTSVTKTPKPATKVRVPAKEVVCPASSSCKSFQTEKHDPIGHLEKFHSRDLIKTLDSGAIKVKKTVRRNVGDENFSKIIYCKQKLFKLYVNINHSTVMVHFSVTVTDTIKGKFEVDYQRQIRSKKYTASILPSDYSRFPFRVHAAIPKDLCCFKINGNLTLIVYLNLFF